MPTTETYRKQAKLLVRWHHENNYSVGEKVRRLERFRHLTDREILDLPMPLTLAQEVVAVEAGFSDWAALKAATASATKRRRPDFGVPVMADVVPVLFVRDVGAAVKFYDENLGFKVDFLHGKPAFYASISRDSVCLHLRRVLQPNFSQLATTESSLILATIEVTNVRTLFEAFSAKGVEVAQSLTKQAWGGTDFHVRDLDGNVISFVQY